MKENRGITIVALVITIIIMLILVGTSVILVIKSGLITKAKDAVTKTTIVHEQEKRLGETINVDGVEYTIDEYIDLLDGNEGKDKNGLTIAQGENTFPYLPDNNSEITNNSLTTGLTVKDNNGNEWVWIEVPTSIYTNNTYNTASTTGDMQPENSEDYEKIRYCIETYAKTLIPEGSSLKDTKDGFRDYWYFKGGTNIANSNTVYSKDPLTGDQYKNNMANSDDISSYTNAETPDETRGTGLTFLQYQTKYKAMLKSTYENGGFYIGKYETGTMTARGNKEDALTTAVIKENAYPYNYVTISQAEAKAESLATGRKNNKFTIWSAMGFSIKAFK